MNRINFDDLKKGQWIVITGMIEEETGFQEFSPWMPRQRHHHPDGRPLEVLAVDLPFILVEAVTGDTFTVDTRRFTVQRTHKKYVEEAAKALETTEKKSPRSRIIKKRKVKIKPDPRDCVRCGTRMVQRRVEGGKEWRHVCPGCGFDKGPVETP